MRDGRGYQFWAEMVQKLDAINPQIAARLARALDRWTVFAEPYQGQCKRLCKRWLRRKRCQPM